MNAFFLIDKEAGISSFDVIRSLRKILKTRKIGHCGTLDPFATGLMICACGQYTRLLKFAESQYKSYEAELLLGKKTSTGDPEGEIISEADFKIDPHKFGVIKTTVLNLNELPIPQFSAVKINGKRAYSYARQGEQLIMPSRTVQIEDFEILDFSNNSIIYRTTVSKGTYIRSLSERIAEELGSVGTTIALRRTAIGQCKVEQAYKVEDLRIDWQQKVCSPQLVLHTMKSGNLNDVETTHFLHGNRFECPFEDCKEMAIYTGEDRLIGIACIEEGVLIPLMVMPGAEE